MTNINDLQNTVQDFLVERGFEYGKGYKIHFSTSYATGIPTNYSALIEYKDEEND